MSLLIYMTAKAMTTMIGVSEDKIPLIAMVTGFVAVIYTSLGGLRAVVITDFIQTVLLFGGALLVLATITYSLGGFSWVPHKMESCLGYSASLQYRSGDSCHTGRKHY